MYFKVIISKKGDQFSRPKSIEKEDLTTDINELWVYCLYVCMFV